MKTCMSCSASGNLKRNCKLLILTRMIRMRGGGGEGFEQVGHSFPLRLHTTCRYQKHFTAWEAAKADSVRCKELIADCRKQLLSGFAAWYQEVGGRVHGISLTSDGQGPSAIRAVPASHLLFQASPVDEERDV